MAFGYQVLGFGSAPTAVAAAAYFGDRGVWCGGADGSNVHHDVMDYVALATTGNATDFGDLALARFELASCSNGSRGITAGGEYP